MSEDDQATVAVAVQEWEAAIFKVYQARDLYRQACKNFLSGLRDEQVADKAEAAGSFVLEGVLRTRAAKSYADAVEHLNGVEGAKNLLLEAEAQFQSIVLPGP